MRAAPVFIASLISSLSFAQTSTTADPASNVVPGYVMATPPTIDGKVDEAVEWKDVPSFEGLVDSETGAMAPQQGKFWLAYDSKFIYFAAKLPDDQPGKIVATEYRTNVSVAGNDDVAIILDPFGTLGEFNVFQINPRGATNLRIAGGRAAKREWLGEILAKGSITKEGWEAEVRIPWSIMRLPPAGSHDLRFNVFRWSPRFQRDTSWRFMGGTNVQNTPHWTNVNLPPPPPRVLRLLPYNYSGVAEKDGTIANMGLDLKTSITDSLDFVGTVNPDFRNIENQVLSLDFSYFERLAGEVRPFFLEGGNFFHTSNDAPIFISQRINEFDAGAKVYGKLGPKTDLALLNTSDFGELNNFVFNANTQMSPRTSYRLAYSGIDSQDVRNDAFHTEYRNGSGPWDFFYQFAGTSDSQTAKGLRHNTGFTYSNQGVNGVFEYSSVTSRFNPRLGFAPQRSFQGLSGSLDTTHPLKHGPLLEEGYSVFARGWDRFSGDKYLHNLSVSSSHTWRNGFDLDMGVDLTEFGGFKDHVNWISLEHPRSNVYRRWQLDYSFGEVEGRDYANTGLSLSYRPLQPLQIQATYQLLQHRGTHTQTIVSANYDLGNDLSISGRALQFDDNWNAYVALRRSGNSGMEYFLILGDPNAEKWRSSLILKVTYPLQLFFGK